MKARVLTSILLCTLLLTLVGNAGAGPAPMQGQLRSGATQAALDTAFTYQGSLSDSGGPVSSTCDFQFKLYSAASGETQVGSTVTKSNITVSNGVFTVQLDFGSDAFNGDARYLDISVRCPAGSGSYTLLTPRQVLAAVPYALYTLSSWNLSGNNGTNPATNFLGTTDYQPLVIKTNGNEAMRIDTAGQLGVWATSNLHPGITVKSLSAGEHYGGYWLQEGGAGDQTKAGMHLDDNNYFRLRMYTGTEWYDALTIANEAGAFGNVGIDTASPTTPTAKLTIDNVGSNDTFGHNAIYVASTNRYFDFHNGLMFRGEGDIWASRFTSTPYMGDEGEIVGIYKEEITPGDTRLNQPPQGPIAVFKNDGAVGIGTNTNLGPSLTVKSADQTPYSAIALQSGSSDTNYVDLKLDDNNNFIVATFDGSNWHDSLIIETSSGFLGYGYGTTDPQYLIHLNGGAYSDGATWVNGSSREYKTDITPLSLEQAQEALVGLDAVTFRYKADETGEWHVGFIAEDVPELVATADRKGLSAMDIVAVLATVVQDQQATLAEQNIQLATQQERIDDLETRLSALEQGINTAQTSQQSGRFPTTSLLFAALPMVGLVLAWQRRGGGRP